MGRYQQRLHRRAEVSINQMRDAGYQHQRKGRHETAESGAQGQYVPVWGRRLELL